MITYTWSIHQLERQPETGAVVTAHWRLNATDGKFTASSYGSVNFSPDPNCEDFMPFESLTEEIVLKWIWSCNNGVDKNVMEETVAKQIEIQKNPPVVSGTPW